MTLITWAIFSVLAVSLLSFVGVFTLGINESFLKKILIYFVSFSAGALFGDVFIHLLPDVTEKAGFTLQMSGMVLTGIVFSFFLEKIIHWHHCHQPFEKGHVHEFAIMNIIGDCLHNFIDGFVIGAGYLAGLPIGIATSAAVIFHEIPHEMGNFAILVHGGFSRKKALLYNFLSALPAVAGTLLVFVLSSYVTHIQEFLIPFAAGNLIYIAGSDLIPELHKEEGLKKSAVQLVTFILGMVIMFALLAFG
jgi:zinc and cadmium transporter